jgi:flagellar hook assembly protein FlgD
VATLADGEYSAGYHNLTWDGRRLDGTRAAAGIYFYRLVTEEGTQSRRLMVLR